MMKAIDLLMANPRISAFIGIVYQVALCLMIFNIFYTIHGEMCQIEAALNLKPIAHWYGQLHCPGN